MKRRYTLLLLLLSLAVLSNTVITNGYTNAVLPQSTWFWLSKWSWSGALTLFVLLSVELVASFFRRGEI
jgi:hypothetical protein